MDEQRVIQKCLNGDVQEFELLVRKYQASIMALAVNMVGDVDEARDVAQDTLVQAYVNLHRFDIERKFKTWVLSIAAKRSIDHLRKRKTFFKFFNQQVKRLGEKPAASPSPLQKSDLFRQLLKGLRTRERTAVILKFNENYSAREIAEVLGCSENTARVHLFNAKVRLRHELQKMEVNYSLSTMQEVLK